MEATPENFRTMTIFQWRCYELDEFISNAISRHRSSGEYSVRTLGSPVSTWCGVLPSHISAIDMQTKLQKNEVSIEAAGGVLTRNKMK